MTPIARANSNAAGIMNTRFAASLKQSFAVSNDEAGFAKLYTAIRKHPKEKVVVGLEATSFYGKNLIMFLAGHGYNVALTSMIEPLSLWRFRVIFVP